MYGMAVVWKPELESVLDQVVLRPDRLLKELFNSSYSTVSQLRDERLLK